ncbi:MAG: HEAT repeat domain-containing protein, partial [Terracidiphilus sp.]
PAAQAARAQAQPATTAGAAAPAEIANISSIVRQPNSGRVEVRYNQVVPQRIEGSLDDPAIRQLLMLASENSASAGVRDDSVELMAAECRAGHSCTAAGIRDALLVVLRYDKNADVREKALKGLEPYVAEDVRVRDAVLEALMNDGDPRIRTAAINILQPVEADTSVRQVLYSVSNTDRNPYIRTVSRQVLNNVPEIQ